MLLLVNNAASVLAGNIGPSDTIILLASGEGARFPSPTGGDYFYITVVHFTTGDIEIMKCTARSGDSLTVERGRDGTTAISLVTNSVVEARLCRLALYDVDWARARGVANGVASLDGAGLIPDAQIPAGITRDSELTAGLATKQNLLGFTPVQQGTGTGQEAGVAVKLGAVGGAAGKLHLTLDSTDKGAMATESWVTGLRGAANGVASLDATSKVPTAQIPPLNYLPINGGSIDGNLDVNGTLNVDGAATFANNAKCFSTAAPTTGRMGLNSAGDRFVEYDGTVYKFGGAVDVQAQDFVSTSDVRLKRKVMSRKVERGFADKLRLHTWDWKDSGAYGQGVIAQEVEKFAPQHVRHDYRGYLSVDKSGLLLEAVVDLAARVRDLERLGWSS